MKKFLIDTDVILDFLSNRAPFAMDAEWLFDKAKNGEIALYVCSISFNNVHYTLRKIIGHQMSMELLSKLMSWTHYISVSEQIMKDAIHSKFNDFEDGIQYYSAKTIDQISAIITRNIKDYKNSEIPF